MRVPLSLLVGLLYEAMYRIGKGDVCEISFWFFFFFFSFGFEGGWRGREGRVCLEIREESDA